MNNIDPGTNPGHSLKEKSTMKTVTNEFGGVQGDVPILRVDELTPGGKPTIVRVVALGEATGHHHEIKGDCQVLEVKRVIDGVLFPGFEIVVREENQVHLYHKSDGEHDIVEMAPGFYFIPAPGHQQVEYDGENERRVLD